MGNLRVPFPGNKGLLTNNDGEYNFLARPFFFLARVALPTIEAKYVG